MLLVLVFCSNHQMVENYSNTLRERSSQNQNLEKQADWPLGHRVCISPHALCRSFANLCWSEQGYKRIIGHGGVKDCSVLTEIFWYAGSLCHRVANVKNCTFPNGHFITSQSPDFLLLRFEFVWLKYIYKSNYYLVNNTISPFFQKTPIGWVKTMELIFRSLRDCYPLVHFTHAHMPLTGVGWSQELKPDLPHG